MEDPNKNSPRNKHTALLAGASALACTLVLVGWVLLSRPGDDHGVSEADSLEEAAPESSSFREEPLDKTVGTEWQWDNFPERKYANGEHAKQQNTSAPFDVPFIYDALQDVRLDEQGNVVVDDEALKALDETLKFSGLDLSPAALNELQELIRIGLPGSAGVQTADIVGNYYRFLQAEKEFNELYRSPGMNVDLEAGYEELVALRELYLGADVASELFEKQDRDGRYMLQSMLLERDESLSAEEKQARQEQLSSRFHSPAPQLPRWEERYRLFQYEQQAILESAVSDAEKQRQTDLLLQQHFDTDEIPAVEAFLNGR
ncbi:hypothetical protein F6455_13430 [Proteobacteria bacterium 005FR1]|nr:hypothetical protein [Proteobacteria bacterium 005FR1]